jgi:hypothetical protein
MHFYVNIHEFAYIISVAFPSFVLYLCLLISSSLSSLYLPVFISLLLSFHQFKFLFIFLSFPLLCNVIQEYNFLYESRDSDIILRSDSLRELAQS